MNCLNCKQGIFVFIGVCAISMSAAGYYQPQAGRFMQRDPMQYVDGMNLYEYVKSNSLKYLDPTGEYVEYDPVEMKLNEKSTSTGARGQTDTSLLEFTFECNPKNKGKGCGYLLTLKIKGHIVIYLLGNNDPSWNNHFPRYDSKWGTPRSNAAERQACLHHEFDHSKTSDAFMKEMANKASSYDGTTHTLSKCKSTGQCILDRIKAYLSVMNAHSNMFDNGTLNQGDMYNSNPFTATLDLSPCK